MEASRCFILLPHENAAVDHFKTNAAQGRKRSQMHKISCKEYNVNSHAYVYGDIENIVENVSETCSNLVKI